MGVTYINPFLSSQPLTAYDEEVMADSPSGYWKLEADFDDYSGNARHLTVGQSPTTGAAALFASATASTDFEGGNYPADNVYHLDAAWQSPHAGASGLMTLECWAEFDSLAAHNVLFWKGTTSNFEFGLTALSTGALQFAVFTSSGTTAGLATSATGLITTSGGPYHLVGTWDRAGNVIKAYIDATEVATAATTSNSTDGVADMVFGFRQSGTDRIFNGRASHLAMYPTALSGARVSAHFAAA